MGKFGQIFYHYIWGGFGAVPSTTSNENAILPEDALILRTKTVKIMRCIFKIFPCHPIHSHAIPNSRKMRRANKNAGAAQDPEQGDKRQLHTGSPFHPTQIDPARGRADISPRWLAQLDTLKWDRGGPDSGSGLVRLLISSTKTRRNPLLGQKRGPGARWQRHSEASSIKR